MALYFLLTIKAFERVYSVCTAGILSLLPEQMPLVPLTAWKRASPISVITQRSVESGWQGSGAQPT